MGEPTKELAPIRQRRAEAIIDSTGLNIAPQHNQPRDKRDAPECVVNYKAQRQLLVGCSQPNVIEVRPKCNDDGDEGNFI